MFGFVGLWVCGCIKKWMSHKRLLELTHYCCWHGLRLRRFLLSLLRAFELTYDTTHYEKIEQNKFIIFMRQEQNKLFFRILFMLTFSIFAILKINFYIVLFNCILKFSFNIYRVSKSKWMMLAIYSCAAMPKAMFTWRAQRALPTRRHPLVPTYSNCQIKHWKMKK